MIYNDTTYQEYPQRNPSENSEKKRTILWGVRKVNRVAQSFIQFSIYRYTE